MTTDAPDARARFLADPDLDQHLAANGIAAYGVNRLYVHAGHGPAILSLAARAGLHVRQSSTVNADLGDAAGGELRLSCTHWPIRDLAAPVARVLLTWDALLRAGTAAESDPMLAGLITFDTPGSARSFTDIAAEFAATAVGRPERGTWWLSTHLHRDLAVAADREFAHVPFAAVPVLTAPESLLATLLADQLPTAERAIDGQLTVFRDIAHVAVTRPDLVDVSRTFTEPATALRIDRPAGDRTPPVRQP